MIFLKFLSFFTHDSHLHYTYNKAYLQKTTMLPTLITAILLTAQQQK